jgi:hypothetical protein
MGAWQLRCARPQPRTGGLPSTILRKELGQWAFDLRTQDVIITGPLAVERGVGTLSFTVEPDTPPEMDSRIGKAHYLAVWQLEEDGEWRILWDAPVEVGTGDHN